MVVVENLLYILDTEVSSLTLPVAEVSNNQGLHLNCTVL